MRKRNHVLYDISAASAIEFAILAPIFILVLLTILAFAVYFSANIAVQQVAADAARTAVAGLNAHERQQLVIAYVNYNVRGYAFLNPDSFVVSVADDPANSTQFTVTVEYDASHLPIWNLYSFAMPSSQIRHFSTIRIGGI